MGGPVEEFDVFVSYRQVEPDRTWVRELLVPGLRKAGLRVCIDDEFFTLGRPLVLEMARAVEASRRTVAVITPRYLRSTFTELEYVLAQHLGMEKGRYLFIGVLREPCRPTLGMRANLMLDMTRNDVFDTQMKRLVDVLASESGGE